MDLSATSLLVKQVVGKCRRLLTTIPTEDRTVLINNEIRFPFRALGFLNREDMKAILSQSYETVLTHYMCSTLKPGNIVIDVGGNVGYISAFAASLVGEEGQVHIFEPLNECFERLEILKRENQSMNWLLNNCAVGSRSDVISIKVDMNGNSRGASAVLQSKQGATRKVTCIRLDDYWDAVGQSVNRIGLVKIDVEGFEFSVLKGMERLLTQNDFRAAIVCEVNPWVAARQSYTLNDISKYMEQFGYGARWLHAPKESLHLEALNHLENILFVRE